MLSNKSIQSTVGNLLTIGSAAGTPTTGTLQNGVGQDVTSLTLDELQVNRLVQTQATIAANGTTLSGATLLSAGVNLVTSADSSNIAVKLPDSQLGLIVNVVNTSSRDIQVFPFASTHSLVGLSAGASFTVPADNQLYQFVCVQNPVVGVWSVITPTSNNTVKKSVSVSLTADGTHTDGDLSYSSDSSDLLDFSATTFGSVTVLDNPASSVSYFDSTEFDSYNKVRITRLTVKSNVLAGDLTASGSQLSSTLMGLTSSQFGTLGGFIRTSELNSNEDGGIGSSLFNSYIFTDGYSVSVANGVSTGYVSAYNSGGTLYQQINIDLPNAGWEYTKDSNGHRRIYYSPFLEYGSASASQSGFPVGFSFECEVIAEFEFSM